MKYIEKVIRTNVDDESYEYGHRLDLSNFEVRLIEHALEMAVQESVNHLHEKQGELLGKFKQIDLVAGKGLYDVDLDEERFV